MLTINIEKAQGLMLSIKADAVTSGNKISPGYLSPKAILNFLKIFEIQSQNQKLKEPKAIVLLKVVFSLWSNVCFNIQS